MSEAAAPEGSFPALPASPHGRGPSPLPPWVAFLARWNSWANHDFCPWANRYVAWLKTPLAWMVAAAFAAGLVGIVAAPQGWVVCGALAGTAMLGAVWPLLAVRGVSAELSFERTRCHEGDEVFVELAVANRWPWPVWGLLIEGCIDGDAALARVPAWSKARYRFAWRPERRGSCPRRAPQVATGFPFGLWTCRRPIVVDRGLIVWPRLIALRSAPFHRGERTAIAGGLVDRPGDEGDLISARAYRPGDSPRRIHWAHTSRRDMLIVSERQMASQRHAVVILDPRAFTPVRDSSGEASESDTRPLDAAVRVLASICLALHRHGWRINCELDGEAIQVSAQPTALRSLWDRLALYGAGPKVGGAETMRSPADGGLRIVVTDVAGWQARQRAMGRRTSESVRWVVVGMAAPDQPVELDEPSDSGVLDDMGMLGDSGMFGIEPWIRVEASGGEEGERDWRRQWERRCHGDEAFA